MSILNYLIGGIVLGLSYLGYKRYTDNHFIVNKENNEEETVNGKIANKLLSKYTKLNSNLINIISNIVQIIHMSVKMPENMYK